MSKTYVNYLLIALGLLIVFLSYIFVFQSYSDKSSALEKEITTMTARLNQLKSDSASMKTYSEGIDKSKASIADTMRHYPNDVRPEDFIMFSKSLETQFGMLVDKVAFSNSESISKIVAVHNTDNYKVPYETVNLTVQKAKATIEGKMDYTGLKNAISYIYSQDNLTKLDSLNISYDNQTGKLLGTFTISKYYITGGDDEYYPTKVPDISLGNTRLFGVS